MKRKVTSHDVAKTAGVSQSTVSKAFTKNGRISDETKQHILNVASELGYHPNAFARNLSQQKSNIVGIMMGKVDNQFYPHVLEVFSKKLRELGKQIMFIHTDDEDSIEENLLLALQYNVEAMIMTSVSLSTSMTKTFQNANVPVILFNRYSQDDSVHKVVCDNFAGGQLAAKTLLELGKERLAFVGGNPNTSTNQDRKQGFVQYLDKHAKTLELALESNISYEWGKQAAQIMLSQKVKPDGIFCNSDTIALGVIDGAKAAKLSIPDDVAIIGFDDIHAASWDAYQLTTLRQPVEAMINKTLDILIREESPALHKLEIELIRRSSA